VLESIWHNKQQKDQAKKGTEKTSALEESASPAPQASLAGSSSPQLA